MNRQYEDLAGLMLQILPCVAQESCFALKGGTAINFFVRDMPRISVDIDLTYIPLEPRGDTLPKIAQALHRIKLAVKKMLPGITVLEKITEGIVYKLIVIGREGEVKIEPNLTMRGAAYPVEKSRLSKRTVEKFRIDVEMNVLSTPDLYGGKICAALDRQHPRDLFDIHELFRNEGLTPEVRKAFIVYWLSSDRPLHELIDPRLKDVKEIFNKEFFGMTDAAVDYNLLVKARSMLISRLHKELTLEERRFVLSVKEGNPDWSLFEIENIANLPAVQWKLKNIKKMDPKKHKDYVRKLKEKLGL